MGKLQSLCLLLSRPQFIGAWSTRFAAWVALLFVVFVSTGYSQVPTMTGSETANTTGVSGTPAVQGPQTTSRVTLDAEVVTDFRQRVDQYMELQEKLQKEGIPQKTRADIGRNIVSQQALAARIRAARRNARQGDIFTPAIAETLRRAMNPELRGGGAAETRASIREDAPAKFALQVNDAYPKGASLPTMPTNVLQILPPLPEGLEYRIVDAHLILVDLEASIIVDYLFDVMCARC